MTIIPAPVPLDLNEGPKPAAKTNVQTKSKKIMAHKIGALRMRMLRPTLSVSSFKLKFLLECNNSHGGYGLTHASNFFFSTVWFVLSSVVDS
jgi:hypothetical protein